MSAKTTLADGAQKMLFRTTMVKRIKKIINLKRKKFIKLYLTRKRGCHTKKIIDKNRHTKVKIKKNKYFF